MHRRRLSGNLACRRREGSADTPAGYTCSGSSLVPAASSARTHDVVQKGTREFVERTLLSEVELRPLYAAMPRLSMTLELTVGRYALRRFFVPEPGW